MSTRKVFYSFHKINEHVHGNTPIEVDQAELTADLLGKLRGDGDFLGIVDDQDTTLQVLYKKQDDPYWIEIPDPSAQGSYGRHIAFDELVDLFNKLPERFDPSALSGLTFEPWKKPTARRWWQFWK